jgi:Zn-dependent protease with chaperone function
MKPACAATTWFLLAAFGVAALMVAARAAENTASPQSSLAAVAAPAGSAPVPIPAPTAEALSYHRSGNVLWIIRTAWELAVPALMLFTGLSAGLRDWAQRVGRRGLFVVVLYFVALAVLYRAVNLPLDFYLGFVRQHAYGLSNQSLGKWFGDWLKMLAVLLSVGGALLWLPYLVLRKSPRHWWLIASLGAVPLVVLTVMVAPVWLDPLFNEFGPMKDKALEKEILTLAQRAGIEGSRVFEVNKSVDTKAVNAYVTGLLGTHRIVLWDTIIARLDRRELLVVMGHEMGHYVLGHVQMGVALTCGFIALTFYGLHRVSGWALRRFGERWGVRALSDVASLPLFVLLFQLAACVLQPASNAFSRLIEHEADRFGLELTRDNHAAATSFVKLQHTNLGVPRPGWFYKIFRASHPTLGERIDFCNAYRPWAAGRPSKYETRFRLGPTDEITERPDRP